MTMSSIYFPAHVIVLFRRIVNVVSTISLSNQYVLSTQTNWGDDAVQPNIGPSDWRASIPSKQSLAHFRNIEWPRWSRSINWNGVSVVGEEIRTIGEIQKTQELSAGDDYGGVLKGVSMVLFGMVE
jgi:triacylglycerol lipase